MTFNYNKWDTIYRKNPLNTLGWELGRPRPVLVELIDKCYPKRKNSGCLL